MGSGSRHESFRTVNGSQGGFETVTLASPLGDFSACIATSAGMVICSLQQSGRELLDRRSGLGAYVRDHSTMGVPFLYPWANRLSGFQFEFEGRQISIDPRSPLLHFDSNGLPMHGLLAGANDWKVRDCRVDENCARLEAELDFAADPRRYAAFPFRHRVAIEVILRTATLEVTLTVRPDPGETVPIAFGFHPYLLLPDDRNACRIELPVRRELALDDQSIPTGQSQAVSAGERMLSGNSFDDAFSELVEPKRFVASCSTQSIAVEFGRGYDFAQVFSPAGASFVCFEPMTAATNALVSGTGLRSVRHPDVFAASFRIVVGDGSQVQ